MPSSFPPCVNPSPEKSVKKKILDAAGNVFGRMGYKAATIREICRSARVNVAAINYYFGGKEELYRTVVMDLISRTFARYPVDGGGAQSSPAERLRSFIRGSLRRLLSPDGLSGYPGKGQLVVRELADPSAFMDELVNEFIRPTADLDYASSVLAELLSGSRPEVIERAKARVGQARFVFNERQRGSRAQEIAEAEAEADLVRAKADEWTAKSELFCPFDGVVLSTSAEAGAYMSPGSAVLTVGDIQNVWLRAFVNETDLGRVRLGQSAEVTVDAYRYRSWNGRISFISSAAEFTPRSVQTFKERTNLVYRIKIQLDNPDGALKPGMPAGAVIEAGP